jgi:hypothetical protein
MQKQKKQKLDKWDHIMVISFCRTEETKWKGNLWNGKNITNYVSNKGLVSKMIRDSYSLIPKMQIDQFKQ